jgi:D-amino-acid oxidase
VRHATTKIAGRARGARVLVVGGGVSGLASASALLERGFEVLVREKDDGARIASSVAAAIWHPFAVGGARTDRWAAATWSWLVECARDPESGVIVRRGLECLREADAPPPSWTALHPAWRRARADELPPDRPAGLVFDAPVAEMGLFLPWLRRQAQARGARIERRAMASLEECAREADVVVNCAGLGARELARDAGLEAWRGSVLRVERGSLESFVLDSHGAEATYIVPRSRDCVLGGSVEPGRESLEADPATLEAIRARCTARVPQLAGARILSHATHLRPWRREVRLEAERLDEGALVVHNYGHGGAGVTLARGCALDVAELVARHLAARVPSREAPTEDGRATAAVDAPAAKREG